MPSKAKLSPPKKTQSAAAPKDVASASVARQVSLQAIANELRAARERSGLTVSEIHRQTGISRTVLQGYEAARFAPGTLELRKICEVLKVTPNRIVFGEEKPMESKPLLASYVGDLSKATNTARIAVILQVLTAQELNALLALIESIVIQRIGGPEELKIAMEAVDLIFSIDPSKVTPELEKFGESLANTIPIEKLAELDKRAEKLKASKARRAR